MVNFRFHLVSLIAVFLALGLGILTGSAVVNQATVQGIRREIRDVRAEVNDLRDANGALTDELGRTSEFVAESAAFAVDGRLTGVPVAIVAERGVAEDAVDDTANLVRTAGADAPAVVWLEERWKLESEEDAQALRDATDLLGGANSVRTRALEQLAARLSAPAPPVEEGGPADLLERLSEGGFIAVDGDDVDLAQYPTGRARALTITGTESAFSGTDVTLEVAQAFVDAEAPTVAGEVFVQQEEQQDGDAPPARGEAVASVRTSDTLAAIVSTVDDLDLMQGRVAAVLALQQIADGVVGHYGYGEGASSNRLPAPPDDNAG